MNNKKGANNRQMVEAKPKRFVLYSGKESKDKMDEDDGSQYSQLLHHPFYDGGKCTWKFVADDKFKIGELDRNNLVLLENWKYENRETGEPEEINIYKKMYTQELARKIKKDLLPIKLYVVTDRKDNPIIYVMNKLPKKKGENKENQDEMEESESYPKENSKSSKYQNLLVVTDEKYEQIFASDKTDYEVLRAKLAISVKANWKSMKVTKTDRYDDYHFIQWLSTDKKN